MKHLVFLAEKPNGRLLAAGESKGVVEVWDLEKSERILSLKASGEIRLSPDGNRIAIFNEGNHSIDIFDVKTGNPVTTLKEFPGGEFTFSPDNSLLAAGLRTGNVRLWDVNTGTAVSVLTEATSSVMAVAFSPNREMLAASGSNGVVWIWDTRSGVLVRTIQGFKSRNEENPIGVSASALAFSPNSRTLALGSTEGLVRLVDVASGDLVHNFDSQINPIRQVVFHPTGASILSFDQDAALKVWETSTGALLNSLTDFGNGFQGIQFQNNGDLAAWKGSILWSVDPATGQVLKITDIQVANIKAVDHDGKILAAADQKEMQLWDSISIKPIASLEGEPEYLMGKYGGWYSRYGFYHAIFSSDDQVLAAAGSGGQRLWNVPQEKLLLQTYMELSSKVALSPDKRFIARAFFDPSSIALWDSVIIHDTENNRSVIYLDRDEYYPINQLIFSPDGNWMATTSDSSVRIWKARNGELVKKIGVVSEGNLAGLAFSPDQKILAVGGPDGNIYLFNTDTFQSSTVLSGHKGSVVLLAFSQDGRFLASAGEDGTIQVWGVP